MSRRLALIGRNVGQSKSKLIHERLCDCRYDLISCEVSEFEGVVNQLKKNYDGFNVTMPYKEMILPYLDSMSEEVQKTGSCNTVRVDGGSLYGDTTDGNGFVLSIGDEPLVNKNVLLNGSGGAARSIAYSLVKAGANLSITARNCQKAQEIAENLKISAKIYDKVVSFSQKYDIIVNTTSVGMFDDECSYELTENNVPTLAVDIIYHDTPFLQAARRLGARTLNGLGMLVFQAALADICFGEQPNMQSARKLIKELDL